MRRGRGSKGVLSCPRHAHLHAVALVLEWIRDALQLPHWRHHDSLVAYMCMLQCNGLGVLQRMPGAAISWCKATEPQNTFCCPCPVPVSRTPPAADATERLEAVLGGLVDVDVIMGTMPGAIRKAVAASCP